MSRTDITNRIVKIMEKELLLKSTAMPKEDCPLGEDGLGLESLHFLKLLTSLEKEFEIIIEDEYWDYRKMKTMGDLIDYFYGRL